VALEEVEDEDEDEKEEGLNNQYVEEVGYQYAAAAAEEDDDQGESEEDDGEDYEDPDSENSGNERIKTKGRPIKRPEIITSPNSSSSSSSSSNNNPNENKRCVNCDLTQTPIWRRDETKRLLCNACGLYWKANHRDRPLNLCGNPSKAKRKYTKLQKRTCSECGTEDSKLWKRDPEGNIYCNPCGGTYEVLQRPKKKKVKLNSHPTSMD